MATPKVKVEAPVSLWPNPVPLECGVIKNQPGASEKGTGTSKFTLFNLKKIYNYLKTKGKGAFPHLRYSVWLHIVKNKFGFTDDLAWMYFELFDVVSKLDPAERLQLLQTASECGSPEELESLRKKLSVDTMRFMLFLYIQSTPRLSLKGPASTGDEWPSPESEGKQRFPETARLSFIKHHLTEILQLLADTDEATQETYITLDAMNALDFLICSSEQSGEKSKLGSLARKYSQASGYTQLQNRFSLPPLEQWLKGHLSYNPYGLQAVFSRRREMRVACFSSDGSERLLANSHTAPEGWRTGVLSHLVNQTLAVGEGGLAGCDVHIRNCRRSSIYLLSPLRTVQVEKCSHCVLVLGAVESVVVVSNCDSITLITACRKIHISSSSLCTFHLLTMTRPLVFPSCFHLCLAPYNTFYPQLEAHLLNCGLSPNVTNHWDHPLLLGNDDDVSVVWELMAPESFRPLSIPFSMEGSTQENPCPLPQAFQTVLAARREATRRWYDTVSKAQLTEEQSAQLQTTVRERFQAWLSGNGYDKDIAALSVRDTSQTTSPTKQPVSKA